MKIQARLPLALIVGALLYGQRPAPKPEVTTYVLGLLKKGPQFGTGSREDNLKIQEGHLANIRKMTEAGKLIVSGPTSDDVDIRGVLIFRASTPDEVREIAEEDPAIKSGRLVLELHPWLARASIQVDAPAVQKR